MRPILTLITLAFIAPHAFSQHPTSSAAPPTAHAGTLSWTATAPAEGGWLGVSISPAERGVVVDEVRAGSPAKRAGLRAGDVLLEFDGQEVGEPMAFVELVRAHASGETVLVSFARGENDLHERFVTLGSRPVANAPVPIPAPAQPEARVAPRTPSGVPARGRAEASEIAERRGWLGVSMALEEGEVTLLNVMDDSPAEAGGLRAGDRVLALDGHEVSDLAGLAELVGSQGPGDHVELLVAREGREFRLVLELGERPEDAERALGGLPGLRGNWQVELDRALERAIEVDRDEQEEEGRFARDLARRFREARRGPGPELQALLREHDGEALEELREIAQRFREGRLEAFQQFRAQLTEIEEERRAQFQDWRMRIADRGREQAWRADRESREMDEHAEVEALRREIEELRDRVRQLRREAGER